MRQQEERQRVLVRTLDLVLAKARSDTTDFDRLLDCDDPIRGHVLWGVWLALYTTSEWVRQTTVDQRELIDELADALLVMSSDVAKELYRITETRE